MTMQNHPLFEELLLSDQPLTTEQTISLQEHLLVCDNCRQVSSAWRDIERVLCRAPMIAPPATFMQRWETRLAFDRIIQERRQNLLILCFCIGGAAFLLSLLVGLLFPAIRSLLPLALGSIYQVMGIISTADLVVDIVSPVVRSIGSLLPPTMWAAISVALGGVCVIWMAALRQLAFSRRSV
jgi:hypothetical protein